MKKNLFEVGLYELENHRPSDDIIYQKMLLLAKDNKKMYHCTNFSSLISIINAREFWSFPLSRMNDIDEQERLKTTSLNNDKVFISSFSYKMFDSESDWKEYSKNNIVEAVIFSVNQNWFTDDIFSAEKNTRRKIDVNGKHTLHKNGNDVRQCSAMDFVGVYYDDSYKTEFEYQVGRIKFAQPRYAGFIKKTYGKIKESGEYKNWKLECEIRLRMVLDDCFNCGFKTDKIIVKLNNFAFSDFNIKFSPHIPQNRITEMKKELSEILPKSNINYIL